MARSGFHWLTTDIEYSLVDWETATQNVIGKLNKGQGKAEMAKY